MAFFGALIKRGLVITQKLERRNVDPIQLQKKTLKRLLQKANQTLFGQYYDFKSLLKSNNTIDAFREKVPIHDYNLIHEKWWHMALNNVDNVCWRGKVRYFALSSGTSGAPSKHIPVTEDMFRAMRKAGLKLFFSIIQFDVPPDFFTKAMLMLGGSSDLKNQGGYFLGDLSGINASKPPFWLRPYYKPGIEISKINDWDSRIEEIAKKAPEWDVGTLVGIPAWVQLMIERILEYHQAENIHEIWPNLLVFAHGGVSMGPYFKGFERSLGKPLIYIDTYLASEGFIAFQSRPETKAMKLLLSNGIFFEFIPFNEGYFDQDGHIIGHPPTLTIDQVEEGKDYALLITTCAGAWRYLIGDTVRFTDKDRSEIIITGRTKHFLSICGEHLSVDNMNKAIRQVEEQLNVTIPEFTVAAIEDGRSFAHKWYLGCTPLAESTKLAELLDHALKQINDDYKTERTSVLNAPQIEVISPAIFYDYQQKQGKMGGQNKFPRVMKKDIFAKWEHFVQESLNSQSIN